MKRTSEILTKIQDGMNKSPMVQAFMGQMKEVAIRENWSDEKWEKMKQEFMTTLFYKMAAEYEDIRNELAADVYELYQEA